MKTLRGITLTISIWAVAASLAVSGASATPPEFLTVIDDQNDIEVRVEEEGGGWLSIGRVNVDGPYYDGPAGYNVFKIRRQLHPIAARQEDLLTSLVRGQYRVFGFHKPTMTIYGFRLVQQGAVSVISHIVSFNPKDTQGKRVGPIGRFQYGAPSPDGRYCVLVADGITIVDLGDATYHQYEIDEPFHEHAADPSSGGQVGGGANLSGDYMEIQWNSARTGTLVVKGKDNILIRKIEINIEEGR